MLYPRTSLTRYPQIESQILSRNTDLLPKYLPWLCLTPSITTYRVNLLMNTRESFKAHLQHVLSEKYAKPPEIFELQLVPEVLCIAVCKPVTCHKYETKLKEIVVDSICAASVLRGAHVYAPGVMAMQSGTGLAEQVLVYADLSGTCKKGTTYFGSNQKLFLGLGITLMQRHQLFSAMPCSTGVAIEMHSTISGVPSIGDQSGPNALLQNLPSIVCVRVLQPQAGERVLDMCAAPGNKTTHIAEIMQDRGCIVALDKTERKIALLRAKIKSNQLQCVSAYAFDATKAFAIDAVADAMAPPFAAGSFDRILLDAPCSSLGNRPLLFSKLQPKELSSFANVQRKLFSNAVPLLKVGGVLVYSTCTITEAENEEVVAWALQKYPQLQLVDAMPRFGAAGLPNLGLNEEQRKLVQRFGPPANNAATKKTVPVIDSVGFFIAKFLKIS